MKKFIIRGVRYFIRVLEFYVGTDFDIQTIKRMKQLKKMGVHHSHYLPFQQKWLLDCNIKTVFDIGANIGEYTTIFAELLPEAKIYAYEPLPQCLEKLKMIESRYDRVKIFNLALGSEDGSYKFHKSSWAPASSFRNMNALHKKNYPHSAKSESINVDVKTLDGMFANTDIEKNILIKMDVQGFEDEVIKGGIETMKKAKVLIIECSLQPLYENEPMFHGIYELVYPLGFEYQGSMYQSMSHEDQSFLQADCIFIKKPSL